MNKLTLNQTWKYCLQMWKWIAEQIKIDHTQSVSELKRLWLKNNKFHTLHLRSRCFFCAYASHFGNTCDNCPAKLIDKNFHCINQEYNYEFATIKFYQKLVRLNKKRLSKRSKK